MFGISASVEEPKTNALLLLMRPWVTEKAVVLCKHYSDNYMSIMAYQITDNSTDCSRKNKKQKLHINGPLCGLPL